MYYVVPCDSELYHYGVLGMKWGVRRSEEELARARQYRKDNKTRRTLKRHVSADVQDLKRKARLADEKQKDYDEAGRALTEAGIPETILLKEIPKSVSELWTKSQSGNIKGVITWLFHSVPGLFMLGTRSLIRTIGPCLL